MGVLLPLPRREEPPQPGDEGDPVLPGEAGEDLGREARRDRVGRGHLEGGEEDAEVEGALQLAAASPLPER